MKDKGRNLLLISSLSLGLNAELGQAKPGAWHSVLVSTEVARAQARGLVLVP